MKQHERCPRRCGAYLWRNHDEIFCFNCGTMNTPMRATDALDQSKLKNLRTADFDDLDTENEFFNYKGQLIS